MIPVILYMQARIEGMGKYKGMADANVLQIDNFFLSYFSSFSSLLFYPG